MSEAPNMIDNPPHYQTESGIEAIEVMENYGLGLHLGTAMKYLLRAGRKGDAVVCLQKAAWYLRRWLKRFEDGHEDVPAGHPWVSPETVAEAFALTGYRREAVCLILRSSFTQVGDESVLIAWALRLVEAAIAEESA